MGRPSPCRWFLVLLCLVASSPALGTLLLGDDSQAVLDRNWAELASLDAARGYAAMWWFADRPAMALPFLGKHLRPVAEPTPKHLARLIADLDSQQYATREKATVQLAVLGELAEPTLRAALLRKPSPETRSRIEQSLRKLEVPIREPEVLRQVRAVEALERIGVPAQALLRELAKGAPKARLTREAKESLMRLTPR